MINIADLLMEDNHATTHKEEDRKIPLVDYSDNHVEIADDNIQESYVFSKSDIYINYEKFQANKSNICLITGLSGSGKTTLAEKITKENNAKLIELDVFEHCYGYTDDQLKEAGQVFYDYLSSHKSVWDKLKKKAITGKELGKEINKFVHYCISWCAKDKPNKYVIEGVQIYSFMLYKEIKAYPLIIKNTSMVKSIIQRWKRNGGGKIDIVAELKDEFPQLLAWYKGEEKSLKNFKKAIKDYILNESKLSSKDRNKLEDNEFGIPEDRKFPLNDKNHVEQAIRMFGKADENKKESLAKRISKKAKEYNIDISNTKVNKYLNEAFNTTKVKTISIKDPTFKNYIDRDVTLKNNYKVFLKDYTGELLINLENDELIGYIFVGKTKDSGFINSLWVSKKYRNQGYATKLMKSAISKYKAIDLTVSISNKPAISLYKKLGFVIIGYGDNKKMYWMKLKSKLSKDDKVIKESITESSKKTNLYPVYIVTSYTNTVFGKIIRKATDSTYTHAAISFEPDLQQMYSFGNSGNLSNSKWGGMTCESLQDYLNTSKDAKILVSAVFVKEKDYHKLVSFFEMYLANHRDTRYDYKDLVRVLTKKVSNTKYSLYSICSQFVDSLFKYIGVDLTGIPSNLVTPKDIAELSNNKPTVYMIYEGPARLYTTYKASERVNKLLLNAVPIKELTLKEAKEFPIQFNNEGDLLISKKEKIDFLAEYNKSKKLRSSYVKYKNLEGLKYEASKLWYINTILMKLLETEKNNNKRKDLNNYRSKILTEFSQYLKDIQKLDNKFNFGSYYEQTPFSNTKIKINGSTIKYTTKLLKTIFR